MPRSKEPRRGVDMGHHYSFLGGVVTVGEHVEAGRWDQWGVAANRMSLGTQSSTYMHMTALQGQIGRLSWRPCSLWLRQQVRSAVRRFAQHHVASC
jgi:hypothetical protein